jgi:hypothetical protein
MRRTRRYIVCMGLIVKNKKKLANAKKREEGGGTHTADIGHVVLFLQQHSICPGHLLVPVGSLAKDLLADDDLGELLRRGVALPESEEAQEALEQPALVPGGGARLVVGLQPQDVLIDQGLSPDELKLGSIACQDTPTHTHTQHTIRYSKPKHTHTLLPSVPLIIHID